MTVRHFFNTQNEALTEALYEHDGVPCCSRFFGHLDAFEVTSILVRYRKQAALVS